MSERNETFIEVLKENAHANFARLRKRRRPLNKVRAC